MGPSFKVEFKVDRSRPVGIALVWMDRSMRLVVWPLHLRVGCWW